MRGFSYLQGIFELFHLKAAKVSHLLGLGNGFTIMNSNALNSDLSFGGGCIWSTQMLDHYHFVRIMGAKTWELFILVVASVTLSLLVGNVSAAAAAKSLQLCPTLCNPIDYSPAGSPIPGILQARTLEWVAISFSNA